jgi:hypothetical protein
LWQLLENFNRLRTRRRWLRPCRWLAWRPGQDRVPWWLPNKTCQSYQVSCISNFKGLFNHYVNELCSYLTWIIFEPNCS